MSQNPYAAPKSPAGRDIRPPSKVRIRHAVLIGLTTWLGMYMWDIVPSLWLLTVKNGISPVIGVLVVVVAITLATGVCRANYRPWLGRRSFCLVLAQLGFGIVWAALLAATGAIMSFRAIK
jgi:hypothetical protein